jgi:hypothetical protein
MKSNHSNSAGSASMKWGYAFAGACVLGFALLIQLAFQGLDEETLAGLPAIVSIPYGLAGKLGVTVPLALLGIGLIGRDLLVNGRIGQTGETAGNVRSLAENPGASPQAIDDLEMGEPIPDEDPPARAPQKPAKKIAALAGGFRGRSEGLAEVVGGPVGDSAPVAQRPGSGQVALSSAKYLNKNPGGSFRKGSTNHTSDE